MVISTATRVVGRDQAVLHLTVKAPPEGWRMETVEVPETPMHAAIVELLLAVLRRWLDATGRGGLLTRNLGCRWDPDDSRVGTDPDLVWVEPSPPEGEALSTLRVWEPGHAPPRLAVEVVSEQGAEKDYLEAPARCARLGVEELWVFDPLGFGPSATGGPFALQVWRRSDPASSEAAMTRIYAGSGPAFSPLLEAWLVISDDGHRLRIADDRRGRRPWLTAAEAEAARADAAEAELRRLRARMNGES